MIPLRDENPTRRFPFMTVVLLLLNVAVFAYEVSLGSELDRFVTEYAFVPARFLADPLAVDQLMTVFTSMFMHGGWLHLGGNILYLWIFGNNIEDRLGHLGFVAFYLVCGVIAIAAQTAIDPTSPVPTLGASGAVAGVLGAYALIFPGAAVLTAIPVFLFIEIARLPAIFVIGFWFLLQLAQGLLSLPDMAQRGGGVAFFAHIGGFIAGVALAAVLAGRGDGHRRTTQRGWD